MSPPPALVLAEETPAAPAARPRKPRKRRSRKERVSAPAGFGGTDGIRTFGSILIEAMLQTQSMSCLPAWWPPDRLPGLRKARIRLALDSACSLCLGLSSAEVLACSSEAADSDAIGAILRFVTLGGEKPVPGWPEGTGVLATTAQAMGLQVLILRGPGFVAIVAPATVALAQTT